MAVDGVKLCEFGCVSADFTEKRTIASDWELEGGRRAVLLLVLAAVLCKSAAVCLPLICRTTECDQNIAPR